MSYINQRDDYQAQRAQFIAFIHREHMTCKIDHTGYMHFDLNASIHAKAIISMQRRVIRVVFDICTLTPHAHRHILNWYLMHMKNYSYLRYRISEERVQFIWTIPEGCLWSKRIDRQYASVVRVIAKEYDRLCAMSEGTVVPEVKAMMIQEFESMQAEWTRS